MICTNYLLRIPSTFKFIDDDEAAGYAVNDDAVNVDNDVVVGMLLMTTMMMLMTT